MSPFEYIVSRQNANFDLSQSRDTHHILLRAPAQFGTDLDSFNFACWLAGNPDVTNFDIVIRHNVYAKLVEVRQSEKYVVLTNRIEWMSYLAWIDKVRSWSETTDELVEIPVIPTSGFRTIYMVADERLKYDDYSPSDLITTWGWITTNCEEPVWRSDGAFAFSNVEDATKFKIMLPNIAESE